MLRQVLRRPYRLVRVGLGPSLLNVFTGTRRFAAPRPRTRPRIRARGALAGIRRNVETGGFPAALRVARRLDRAVPAAKAGPVDVEEAGGMRWTEEQDDVLREVSFHGAAFAAAEIERRCPHGAHRGDAREPDPLLARRPDGAPRVRAWRGSTQPRTARTVPRRSRRGSGAPRARMRKAAWRRRVRLSPLRRADAPSG